jgi:hypothetical protein
MGCSSPAIVENLAGATGMKWLLELEISNRLEGDYIRINLVDYPNPRGPHWTKTFGEPKQQL